MDDVTAARRFQEALRQSEEQLRQMQKMEAIGRLAGGVAHDFNNMLAVINGYSEMLLPLTADGTPLHRGLTEIKSAGERSAALTRQLLAFSRKQVLRARVLDLGEVVRGLSGMLRRLIGEDVDLRLHVDEDLGRVRADAGQLEQVVLNLAVNARDAMPQGGTLEIRLRNRDVAPDHARAAHLVAGQYVEMVVADTGHGMEPEIRDRIFEPFFTTKRPGEGTGLGLSTVYGIVRQSEGDVEVESRIGSGTTFRILLPRAAGYEAATPPGPVAALRGGHETILLVEDEEMVRGLVREVLIHQGYRVLEARDAAEARRVSESLEDPLHLLLTDVVMPGDSGCDLARDLHRQRPDLRVLYMSGYTQETVARRGIEEPDFAFIQKPFEPAALVAQVRAVLSAPPRDA